MDIEKKILKLTEMGDYLDSIDNVAEYNYRGFNKPDKTVWKFIRGHGPFMADCLRKYKRQLGAHFGADVFTESLAGFGPIKKYERSYYVSKRRRDIYNAANPPVLRIERDDTLVKFVLSNRTERFDDMVSIQHKHNLIYNRFYQCCVLPTRDIKKFDLQKFTTEMLAIGIAVVGDLPDVPDSVEPFDDSPIQDQAWARLDAKTDDGKLFCLVYCDGYFRFRFSYSSDLNYLFSNKTGQLSGIFEVLPTTWERRTKDIGLAKEALAKAKALKPDWTFATVDLGPIEARMNAKILAEQEPIAEVTEVLNPVFSLFPFQNEFIRFLQRNNGNALIGAEMGLGKTLISLAYCAAQKHRVLVVCPKVVRRTWISEAEKFFPTYYRGVELRADELRKNGVPDLTPFNIASVNFASLSKFLPAIKKSGFNTIIIDESHYVKNENAQITQTVFSMAHLFKHKILLSGTAIKNKKCELYTQVELIRPGLFSSKHELKMATIGSTWNIMQDFYMTRSKQEVLKDLPDKIRSIIDVNVGDCPDITPSMQIGDISHLKIEVAKAKVATTVDFVKETLEASDSSVIVFSDSFEAATNIANALGKDALLHHGQMTIDRREAIKDAFQNGESRVLVAVRKSLEVGATLHRADKVVFNDLPWTPSDIRQAEDRAHRIGQKKMVNVYWIKADNNAWDSNVIDIIARKIEISKKILEGKQVSPEDRVWKEKRLTIAEVLARVKGKKT